MFLNLAFRRYHRRHFFTTAAAENTIEFWDKTFVDGVLSSRLSPLAENERMTPRSTTLGADAHGGWITDTQLSGAEGV